MHMKTLARFLVTLRKLSLEQKLLVYSWWMCYFACLTLAFNLGFVRAVKVSQRIQTEDHFSIPSAWCTRSRARQVSMISAIHRCVDLCWTCVWTQSANPFRFCAPSISYGFTRSRLWTSFTLLTGANRRFFASAQVQPWYVCTSFYVSVTKTGYTIISFLACTESSQLLQAFTKLKYKSISYIRTIGW